MHCPIVSYGLIISLHIDLLSVINFMPLSIVSRTDFLTNIKTSNNTSTLATLFKLEFINNQ